MGKTIRAKFENGVLVPLDAAGLKKGQVVTVTILELPTNACTGDALEESAGGWKGLIDAEELKRRIYEDRLIPARTLPRLEDSPPGQPPKGSA